MLIFPFFTRANYFVLNIFIRVSSSDAERFVKRMGMFRRNCFY